LYTYTGISFYQIYTNDKLNTQITKQDMQESTPNWLKST